MWKVIDEFHLAIGRFSDWALGTENGRLFAAVLVIALAALLRRPLAAYLTAIIVRVLSAIRIVLPESVREDLKASVSTVVVAVALLVAIEIMSLPPFVDETGQRILVSVIVLAFYGVPFRRADVIVAAISPDGGTRLGTDSTWLVRLLRLAIAIMAFATIMEVWELSISGALTGVGVFGAGLAIAAQDFVSNFVAGLNNISERRFRPGDWIKVENGVEGTVMSMDLRSTTVMGFDRVPRYVPNSDLANAVLLNFNRMDHRRVYWTFGLKLGATDEQVKAVCADLRGYVEESGEFVTDGSLLCFVVPAGLSDSAIEIMIYVFTNTVSYQPYLEVCGRLTMALRAAVERAGTELAYPTRTVILEHVPASDMNGSIE